MHNEACSLASRQHWLLPRTENGLIHHFWRFFRPLQQVYSLILHHVSSHKHTQPDSVSINLSILKISEANYRLLILVQAKATLIEITHVKFHTSTKHFCINYEPLNSGDNCWRFAREIKISSNWIPLTLEKCRIQTK